MELARRRLAADDDACRWRLCGRLLLLLPLWRIPFYHHLPFVLMLSFCWRATTIALRVQGDQSGRHENRWQCNKGSGMQGLALPVVLGFDHRPAIATAAVARRSAAATTRCCSAAAQLPLSYCSPSSRTYCSRSCSTSGHSVTCTCRRSVACSSLVPPEPGRIAMGASVGGLSQPPTRRL